MHLEKKTRNAQSHLQGHSDLQLWNKQDFITKGDKWKTKSYHYCTWHAYWICSSYQPNIIKGFQNVLELQCEQVLFPNIWREDNKEPKRVRVTILVYNKLTWTYLHNYQKSSLIKVYLSYAAHIRSWHQVQMISLISSCWHKIMAG